MQNEESTMKVLILAATLCLLLVSTVASAHHRFGVPTATCATHVSGMPIPQYVCCEKEGKHGDIFANTWVSGGCQNVSGAFRDYGCSIESPNYNTGEPINADCLFSYSTGIYR